MHDEPREEIVKTHEHVVTALRLLVSEKHDTSQCHQIVELLMQCSRQVDTNSLGWIWGAIVKFLASQDATAFESAAMAHMVVALAEELSLQLSQLLGNSISTSQGTDVVSQCGHLTKVYLAICAMFRTHSSMMEHGSPSSSLSRLLPLVQEDFRRKLERYQVLFLQSGIPVVNSTELPPTVAFMMGNHVASEPNLNLAWLLEQLPSFVLSLDRCEAKENFDFLLRLYLSSKIGPLKSTLCSGLIRIASGLSPSDLFTRGLAEQLHIACFYPFSLHMGSLVYGRELQTSIFTLWQRMNATGISGNNMVVVLEAAANLFREGIAGTSNVGPLINLVRGTAKGHEAQLLAVIAEAAPYCSFRHGLDVLDLVKAMAPSAESCVPAWCLIAGLAASKAPPALHKRLTEVLLPFVLECQRLCESSTWPLAHTQFSCLATCAQFASNPSELLDHALLQPSRERFIAFLQTPPALQLPAALSGLRLPSGPWPYSSHVRRSSDPILDSLKRLERLILDCPSGSRSKYLPRIEELLYHCNN